MIGLLNGMVGYSVMAESKREREREKQKSLRRRERKWEKKIRWANNGNKLVKKIESGFESGWIQKQLKG